MTTKYLRGTQRLSGIERRWKELLPHLKAAAMGHEHMLALSVNDPYSVVAIPRNEDALAWQYTDVAEALRVAARGKAITGYEQEFGGRMRCTITTPEGLTFSVSVMPHFAEAA